MIKHTLLIVYIAIGGIHAAVELDPFGYYEKEFSQGHGHPYLWPWSRLMKEAKALEAEGVFKTPKFNLREDPTSSRMENFEFKLMVPKDVIRGDNLSIQLINGNIVVRGSHSETKDDSSYRNYFVQQFPLPPGGFFFGLNAIVHDSGLVTILVPKFDPYKARKRSKKEKETTESILQEEMTEMNEDTSSSTSTLIEELELIEATTHQGKTRKKELKSEDNKLTEGVQENGLDYEN